MYVCAHIEVSICTSVVCLSHLCTAPGFRCLFTGSLHVWIMMVWGQIDNFYGVPDPPGDRGEDFEIEPSSQSMNCALLLIT